MFIVFVAIIYLVFCALSVYRGDPHKNTSNEPDMYYYPTEYDNERTIAEPKDGF